MPENARKNTHTNCFRRKKKNQWAKRAYGLPQLLCKLPAASTLPASELACTLTFLLVASCPRAGVRPSRAQPRGPCGLAARVVARAAGVDDQACGGAGQDTTAHRQQMGADVERSAGTNTKLSQQSLASESMVRNWGGTVWATGNNLIESYTSVSTHRWTTQEDSPPAGA